ncbi:helix-turn-helix domain-containing protein [Arsenicicoccus dermatophilus]|uniref:AlbA family DNA-binding domain-containing protein n=1 Tax=Arsenicicoccus dermatophilus TaxID=1076331 RepID=UPI001F4CF605|nr:ATP-binding protein [Arsenicicoccus dermatophilus]MCH8614428.1 ATP-binding protein [Arsenicicoccus dermatophilus]
MAWTALHRDLGEPGGSWSLGLLVQAVEQALPEKTDLDWKAKLPLTDGLAQEARDKQELELAKDVAAMANTGGGVIVYGVKEKNGRASELVGVGDVPESTRRKIRQVLAARVFPAVVGLELQVITAPAAGAGEARTALALVVPDSVDAPHLVRPKQPKDAFWAPWRDGPETRFMDERALAAAYRVREQTRRQAWAGLDEMTTRFINDLPHTDVGAWVCCAARPLQPLPPSRRLDQTAADLLLAEAREPQPKGTGPLRETSNSPTRRGLRSFRVLSRRTVQQDFGPTKVYAAVQAYQDGSAAVALNRGSAFDQPPLHPCAITAADVEACAIDLLAVLWRLRLLLGASGDYAAQIATAPQTNQVFYLGSTPHGVQRRSEWLPDLRPVTGPIITSQGLDEAQASWTDMVQDFLNQADLDPSNDFPDRMAAAL